MRKPKVAGGAADEADDTLAKALRARMDDPSPIGRTKHKLAALRAFCDAMIAADDLHDSDKAEAVSQAALATLEMCSQIGIGYATRPLLGLVSALRDRKNGRTTDWLKPVIHNDEGSSITYERERQARVVAVATVQVLCDEGMSVKDACLKVSKAIGTLANGVTSITVQNWRHRILNDCSRKTFANILSRARAGGSEVAMTVLKQRWFGVGG